MCNLPGQLILGPVQNGPYPFIADSHGTSVSFGYARSQNLEMPAILFFRLIQFALSTVSNPNIGIIQLADNYIQAVLISASATSNNNAGR
jgi:hypothetical protein